MNKRVAFVLEPMDLDQFLEVRTAEGRSACGQLACLTAIVACWTAVAVGVIRYARRCRRPLDQVETP
jgi:hypothetical protein